MVVLGWIYIFSQLTKRLKIGITECCSSLLRFPILERDGKLQFSNGQNDALRNVSQFNKEMEWKLKLFRWIFYHFRRVNFEFSEYWTIMVEINSLLPLAVSEKLSQNFFSLWVIITITSLRGTCTFLGFSFTWWLFLTLDSLSRCNQLNSFPQLLLWWMFIWTGWTGSFSWISGKVYYLF